MENGLEPETEELYKSVIIKYREQLDETNWKLIRATAQNEAKDRLIAEQAKLISEMKEMIQETEPEPESTLQPTE